MPDETLREELLLAILNHVEYELDTGCWLLAATSRRRALYRELLWDLWYGDQNGIRVMMDWPSCRWPQSAICVSPIHWTNPDLIYSRVDAGATA